MANDNYETEYGGQPLNVVKGALRELADSELGSFHERNTAFLLLDVIYNFDKRLRALEER